jgi:hypothetical protein
VSRIQNRFCMEPYVTKKEKERTITNINSPKINLIFMIQRWPAFSHRHTVYIYTMLQSTDKRLDKRFPSHSQLVGLIKIGECLNVWRCNTRYCVKPHHFFFKASNLFTGSLSWVIFNIFIRINLQFSPWTINFSPI